MRLLALALVAATCGPPAAVPPGDDAPLEVVSAELEANGGATTGQLRLRLRPRDPALAGARARQLRWELGISGRPFAAGQEQLDLALPAPPDALELTAPIALLEPPRFAPGAPARVRGQLVVEVRGWSRWLEFERVLRLPLRPPEPPG